MKRLAINEGDVFGNWKVIKEIEPRRQPAGGLYRVFKCSCICGKENTIRAAHLVRTAIESCGCLSNKFKAKNNSDRYIRKIWNAIRFRTSETNQFKHLYKDKGVKVCNEWLDYSNFREWAEKNKLRKGFMIDRIDTNGIYHPENCRVVTPKENANNRIDTFWIEYKGEKYALKLLLSKIGNECHYNAIRARILRGWDSQKAIDTPIRTGNYKRKELSIIKGC